MTHPRNWPTRHKAVAALAIVALWLTAAGWPLIAAARHGIPCPPVAGTGGGFHQQQEDNSR